MKREHEECRFKAYFMFSLLVFLIFPQFGVRMPGSSKLERDFQSQLIKDLKFIFPGCMVMKLDSGYIQGIPDLLVLWNDKWATLECKRSARASHRPNQSYYVDKMNEMSFSRFIFPENKEEVLHELQQAFRG